MVILEVPCNIESGFGVPNGGGKLETDKFRVVFNPSNRQYIGHRSAGFSEVLPGQILLVPGNKRRAIRVSGSCR